MQASDVRFDARELLQHLMAFVEFPYYDLLDEAYGGYELLNAEPDEVKRLWEFDVNQIENPTERYDADDGLVIRRGEPNVDSDLPNYDEKTFFHYSDRLPLLLAWRGTPIGKHAAFLKAIAELHRRYLIAWIATAQRIDEAVPGANLCGKIVRTMEHKTRLLDYDPKPEGKMIGKEHTDRSAATFHGHDTFPACFIQKEDGSWELVKSERDRALLFISDGLDKRIGGARPNAKKRRHHVKVPEGSPWANQRRKASVFFGRLDR